MPYLQQQQQQPIWTIENVLRNAPRDCCAFVTALAARAPLSCTLYACRFLSIRRVDPRRWVRLLQVTFENAAHFVGNRALGQGPRGQEVHSCGGGVSVGGTGRIEFSDLASFEENSAWRGGALCNRGTAKFFRRSFFNGNGASGGT